MGICPELIDRISNIVYGCRMRVCINSGYSTFYTLNRGVRQGDPLSCLLYDFSIEPLSMRLRDVIRGISVLGLPPARLIMYADDMNLFLSPQEDLALIRLELSATSFAIGSKFNYEKTDILLVGSRVHRSITNKDARAAPLLYCFEGAYFIPDGSPLRILGMWVGSRDLANDRWSQIILHNNKIIRQWNHIGASLRNRVLLAKALLLSRCYYLMDGNGIPNHALGKLSRAVSAFVRGRFSLTPYNLICAPLSEGGLNCPSLHQRKLAYDAKFVSDLLTAPLDVPWKVWTRADLVQASGHRPLQQPGYHHRVDPLLQHAFTRLGDLEPRLRQAYVSARTLRYNITSAFPSSEARSSMPLLFHPAIPPRLSRAPDALLLNWDSRKPSWRHRVGRIMASLDSSPWHLRPSPPSLADPDSVSVTPRHDSALDCARILSGPASLLYAQSGIGKRLFYGDRTRRSAYRDYPLPPLSLPGTRHLA